MVGLEREESSTPGDSLELSNCTDVFCPAQSGRRQSSMSVASLAMYMDRWNAVFVYHVPAANGGRYCMPCTGSPQGYTTFTSNIQSELEYLSGHWQSFSRKEVPSVSFACSFVTGHSPSASMHRPAIWQYEQPYDMQSLQTPADFPM